MKTSRTVSSKQKTAKPPDDEPMANASKSEEIAQELVGATADIQILP